MKKILFSVLALCLITGCGTKEENPVDNTLNNDEIKEVSKEDVLLEEMRLASTSDLYSLTNENVGKTYFVTLRTTSSYASNTSLFEGCDKDDSGYYIKISERDSNIYATYKIYLNCDGKMKIYNYKDISEGAKPSSITERDS